MKKYKFFFSAGLADHKETEIVELPEEMTEKEVEEEFKEWVWNQIDASFIEVIV
ncbi:DUF7167 family protein [Shouchella clausii]|uniref:DUF7167 family protein n=1 Tax=Shouchella clausii TaxID=79880 RepID=UPI001595ED00|nr:hypothetical protein [Shouchella clausii]